MDREEKEPLIHLLSRNNHFCTSDDLALIFNHHKIQSRSQIFDTELNFMLRIQKIYFADFPAK